MFDKFLERSFYAAHFMEVSLWEPYVRHLCLEHGLVCRRLRPGVPGTYPTFICELDPDQTPDSLVAVVIKLFGPPFDGEASFQVERQCGSWLERVPLPVRSPGILFEGTLEAGWQYLVFEYIPGVPILESGGELSGEDWAAIAQQMGELLRVLHAAEISSIYPTLYPGKATPAWDGFVDFLSRQRQQITARHSAWHDLPSHLLDQLEGFVLPVEQLVDVGAVPYLIHADLTADHLLGRVDHGRWQSLALIDWGDARVGNILYELVALYLDLLQADTPRLRVFLEAYDLPDFYRADFPRQALSMALLHQFPALQPFQVACQRAGSLAELAESLFGKK